MTGRLRVFAVIAPITFVLHVIEEAPGFVVWFNAHVARGITADAFWTVNAWALVITVVLSAMLWVETSTAVAVALFAWLSFLFAANAVLHAGAAAYDGVYVPGLITALVLYLPFYGLFTRELLRDRRVSPMTLLATSILSAIPMLVHGYLIVVRGSRLF